MKKRLNKTVLVYFITGLFLFTIFVSLSEVVALEPSNTLYVGGNGTGNYSKIQDAIDDASNGDAIFVYSGIYYENLIVDKSVSLQGKNKEYAIIDGNGGGDVVYISADEVQLSNFTIRNSGIGQDHLLDGAIEITSDDNVIQNVKCLDTNYGIWAHSSDSNTITNNYVDAFYDSIWLDNCYNNFLRDNAMFNSGLVCDGVDSIHDIDTSNTVNGKPIYYYYNQIGITVPSDAGQVIFINCSYCEISNLSIYKATDGISLIDSNYNIIRDNIVHGTTDFGIRLYKSNYNLITHNHISNNLIGIALMNNGFQGKEDIADCKYNVISENNIVNNIYIGISIAGSYHNNITKNNFIESEYYHAYFFNSKDNSWSNNYWDNWIGLKSKLFQRAPKLIGGVKNLFKLKILKIPCFDLDREPSAEPYEI